MSSMRWPALCACLLALAVPCSAHADALPVLGPEILLGQPSTTTRGGYQGQPDIACTDAGRCLVVWMDTLAAHSQADVMAAFVETDGRIGEPFLVADAEGRTIVEPAVATDGTDFVVIWTGYFDDGDQIRAARVSPEATVGEQMVVFAIADDTLGYPDADIAATRDGRFLVVFEVAPPHQFDSWIAGAFIGPDDVVTPYVPLSPTTSEGQRDRFYPAVASDGARFLVTWMRRAAKVDGDDRVRADVEAVLVEADGKIGELLALGANDVRWRGPTGIAFDGTDFLVAWDTPRTELDAWLDIVVGRVSTDGTVHPATPVLTHRPDTYRATPALAVDPGGRVLLTWAQGADEGLADGELRAAVREPNGAWGDEGVLQTWQPGDYLLPAMAWRTDRFVAVWEVSLRSDVVTLEIGGSGQALGVPRPVAVGPADTHPRLVPLGDARVLVLWSDGEPGLRAAVVGTDGTVSDRDRLPGSHGAAAHCTRVAGDGTHTLVTWRSATNESDGVWLDADGNPGTKLALDPDGIQWCLPVATDGTRFLVAWIEGVAPSPIDPGHQILRGALLEPGARTGEPFTIAIMADDVRVQDLTVTGSNGAGFLVAWWSVDGEPTDPDERIDVHAAQVHTDGLVDPRLDIATTADVERLAAVVDDADGFTVVWDARPGRGSSGGGVHTWSRHIERDATLGTPMELTSPEGAPLPIADIAHDGERLVGVWQAGGSEVPHLGAAVWRDAEPPVILDSPGDDEIDGNVRLAWAQQRGLVVYTRNYLLHARTVGAEPPDVTEPTDVAEPTDTARPTDTADASAPATDTRVDMGSPVPTPAPMANPTDGVGQGCCTAVRTPPAPVTAWWELFGLVALFGMATARRRPRP